MDDATRYPLLHRPVRWDWAHAVMTFSTAPPKDDDVVSTHVVGFVGEGVLLCRDQRPDGWFLPGGTREPGESVQAALERVLLEEAGARLAGPFRRLGAHSGTSETAAPFRPHLPHPFQGWLWGWAEVEVMGHRPTPMMVSRSARSPWFLLRRPGDGSASTTPGRASWSSSPSSDGSSR